MERRTTVELVYLLQTLLRYFVMKCSVIYKLTENVQQGISVNTWLDLYLQVSVAADSPGVTVVQLSDGQTVQVQGVIQAPQTSVIQSPVQTVQVRARLCHALYLY